MTLTDYLHVIRRRLVSIIVITALGVIVAAAFTFTATKQYTATAQSFVALSSSAADDSNALSGAQFAQQRVKSYTEIVTSPDVLEPVIQELGLPYSTQQLATKVSATNPPQTVLLDVSATDPSPQLASQIANATSEELAKAIEKLETPKRKATPPVKVTLTQPALPPASPSSPRTTVNLALGFLLGLGLGVAWAFLRHSLDRTVKTPNELEEITGAPTLGVVLFDSNAKGRSLTALDTTSVMSEGYRMIRTNMKFVDVDNPPKVIVVTSTSPGEGKTTTACNLAVAYAQAGHKVCLVEADLRRPRVVQTLEIDGSVGLTNVLSGEIPLEQAAQEWNRGLLHVLPPGPLPPNPSEILGSRNMAETLATLKNTFDITIIDSSPLLAVTDAAVVSGFADGAILVARHGEATRDHVEAGVAAIASVKGNLLGTVLNAVPVKKRGGYGYDYGYGYGYGQAYGDKKTLRAHKKAQKAAAKEQANQPAAAQQPNDLNVSDLTSKDQ